MNERGQCIREADFGNLRADVRLLTQAALERDKKIAFLNEKYEDMHEMNTNLKIITLTLEQVSEHNQKQDALQEKRDAIIANQNKTLEEINANLSGLNNAHSNLNQKVVNLETRFNEAESKSTVDLRELNKQSTSDFLKKNAYPVGVGAAITLIIVEVIKAFL